MGEHDPSRLETKDSKPCGSRMGPELRWWSEIARKQKSCQPSGVVPNFAIGRLVSFGTFLELETALLLNPS